MSWSAPRAFCMAVRETHCPSSATLSHDHEPTKPTSPDSPSDGLRFPGAVRALALVTVLHLGVVLLNLQRHLVEVVFLTDQPRGLTEHRLWLHVRAWRHSRHESGQVRPLVRGEVRGQG